MNKKYKKIYLNFLFEIREACYREEITTYNSRCRELLYKFEHCNIRTMALKHDTFFPSFTYIESRFYLRKL